MYEQGYDDGYRVGYADAVMDLSWTCGDCGNTYGPDVEHCPNRVLDRAMLNQGNKSGNGERT